MVRASASQSVDLGSVSKSIHIKDVKNGIHSFPAGLSNRSDVEIGETEFIHS